MNKNWVGRAKSISIMVILALTFIIMIDLGQARYWFLAILVLSVVVKRKMIWAQIQYYTFAIKAELKK